MIYYSLCRWVLGEQAQLCLLHRLENCQAGLAPSHLYICRPGSLVRHNCCGGLNMPQVHVTLLIGKYPGLIPRAQTPFRAYQVCNCR